MNVIQSNQNKYINQENKKDNNNIIYTKKLLDIAKKPKNENKEIKKSFSRYQRNNNFEYQYGNKALAQKKNEKIILDCNEIKTKNTLFEGKPKNSFQSRKNHISENEIKYIEDRENKKEIRLKYLIKEKIVKNWIDINSNNL